MHLTETDIYTKDEVTSKDGTIIGYRQLGHGPGVIIVHGGMEASQYFMKLAAALSGEFTVYVLDRRGRGMSGAFGDDYSVNKDCEDIAALVEKTGAQNIFGLSSGAIISLRASLVIPNLKKVALYEPPLSINGSSPISWLSRYDREVAQGKIAQALVTVFRGLPVGPWLFTVLPRWLLAPLLTLFMPVIDKPKVDDVSIRELVPTMHYDIAIVRETADTLDDYKTLNADVLLLGGSKSPRFLKTSLDALEKVVPHVKQMTFSDFNHLSPTDDGKPDVVADELRRFFKVSET